MVDKATEMVEGRSGETQSAVIRDREGGGSGEGPVCEGQQGGMALVLL